MSAATSVVVRAESSSNDVFPPIYSSIVCGTQYGKYGTVKQQLPRSLKFIARYLKVSAIFKGFCDLQEVCMYSYIYAHPSPPLAK